eukprot:TRINITY_DN401_c0_g3_i1.p1 TRINITY_DN401_c0_g3~~TRINITY_DN401_c0_g3_i1.p1  ORF type:complete len:653 (-),score=131.78 TRINITY_DN401_c0_g3_i1:75-1961(-)
MQDEHVMSMLYNSYQYHSPSGDRPRANKRVKNITNEEMYHSHNNNNNNNLLGEDAHYNYSPQYQSSSNETYKELTSPPPSSSSFPASPSCRPYMQMPPFTSFEKTVLNFSPPLPKFTESPISPSPSSSPSQKIPPNVKIDEHPLSIPSPYSNQVLSPVPNSNKLYDLLVLQSSINQKLEDMRLLQKTMPLPPPVDLSERLDNDQRGAITTLEMALQQIQHTLSSETLEPHDLFKIILFRQEFSVQMLQLRLFQAELQYLRNLGPARCFASLVIIKQPFPKTLKQGTKSSNHVEDPITIRLIRATRTEICPIGKAKAVVTYDDYQGKKHTLEIQNDCQDLDDQGIATFFNIRFPTGTRMKAVRLQFAVPVKYHLFDDGQSTGGTPALIESDVSHPFIVLTNENQWDVAAGVLLKKELFQHKELTWEHFSNILQLHYLRATRQDLSRPERPLSKDDISYFSREKFFGKSLIREKDFNTFWDWFGKVLYKIRHQKHFCSLWVQGFVWGFVSKTDAENILFNESPGTFLLRFSERVSGKVAVAYVKKDPTTGQQEIKHYLIDSHNEEKQSSTLPEFLAPHAHFLYFLQLNTVFDPPKQSIVKNRIIKSEVLRNYFNSKDDPSLSVAGYDKEL